MRAALFRAGHAASVLLGISVLVFLVFFATPGADPAARLAGRGASPETLASVRREYGLDQTLPTQYARLMRRLFITQDLPSYVNRGQLVIPSVLRAAPVTLALSVGAAALWLAGGLVLGLLAAVWPALGRPLSAVALLGVSVPVFTAGQIVNLLTQQRWHDTAAFRWVPALGEQPEGVLGWVRALAIPCVTLALLYAGLYGRVLRASLDEALRQEFVRTARAKGLSETRVLLRHAVRTSLLTVVALFGLDFGALVGGGTLLIEVVFGLHGLGKLTYDAAAALDLPTVMATVLYAAFFVVLANALVDLLRLWLDPRLR